MSDVSFNIYLIIVLSKVLILFGLFSIWIVWFILHFQLAQCGAVWRELLIFHPSYSGRYAYCEILHLAMLGLNALAAVLFISFSRYCRGIHMATMHVHNRRLLNRNSLRCASRLFSRNWFRFISGWIQYLCCLLLRIRTKSIICSVLQRIGRNWNGWNVLLPFIYWWQRISCFIHIVTYTFI